MEQVTIAALSTDSLFSLTNLTKPTGYRYLRILHELLSPLRVEGWEYQPRIGALSESEIKIFTLFVDLIQNRKYTVKFAQKQLIKELKANGYIPENKTNSTRKQSGNTPYDEFFR